MAHEIFGERFYNRSTEPAWHKLGTNNPEAQPALKVLREVLGEPVTTLEPVYAHLSDGSEVELPWHRALMRHPTPEDDQYRTFAVVTKDYHLVTAGDVCRVWEEHVKDPRTGAFVPVETMGFLRQGSTFFVTSRLPAIDVKGDEVEMYLGAVAPLDGVHAASTERWPLRVVCANTLRMAQERSADRYRVIHDELALERMGAWLAEMYERAVNETELVREALTVLADVSALETDVEAVLRAAYPTPPEVRRDAPDYVVAERAKRRDQLAARVVRYRDGARECFEGKGVGMDHPSCRGTLYGLYQAVSETECWRKGWNRDGREDELVAESLLMGPRGATIQRAHAAAMEVAASR